MVGAPSLLRLADAADGCAARFAGYHDSTSSEVKGTVQYSSWVGNASEVITHAPASRSWMKANVASTALPSS